MQGSSLPGVLHPIRDACASTLTLGSPAVRHGVWSLWGGANLIGSLVMVSTYFAESPYIYFSLPTSYMSALSTLENLLSGKKNSRGLKEFSLYWSWNGRNFLTLARLKYSKVSLNILLSVIAIQMIRSIS